MQGSVVHGGFRAHYQARAIELQGKERTWVFP
jgi:hypothetical protein